MGDTRVSPANPRLPAADPVPGGFLQSPGLPRRYGKALEEGEKGSEGTPWPHRLPLSLLQVLRGVRLSIRLWTSTLKTTTPFRYPTLASGWGWSVPLKAALCVWPSASGLLACITSSVKRADGHLFCVSGTYSRSDPDWVGVADS